MSAAISPKRRGGAAPEPCGIAGCGSESMRSLARTEVRRAYPDVTGDRGRIELCRAHYKEFKKATRTARELDRLAW
ncbi:MAG: hypothetical protein ACRECR_07425 [Thermoplasmata archaeon]